MNDSKSYKITLFGENYTLVSDESEQHIVEVSQRVDLLMKEIALKLPQAPTEKVAVLVALQLASQLLHAKELSTSYELHQEQLVERINQELHRLNQ